MSLLDDLKQTVSGAASTARDVGQTLGAQAQAQLAIKRLQLDQAKKYHELGLRTHEWHKAGNLIATGPVPREVQQLCLQLDDINSHLDEQTHKLEEAKRQAELRAETRNLNRAAPAVEATMTSTPIDAASVSTHTASTQSTPSDYSAPASGIYPADTSPSAQVTADALDIPAPTYVIDPSPASATGGGAATPAPGTPAPGDPQTLSDPRPGNPTRPLPPSG
ncbi:MAG TPA: hypothetical protein VF600_02990 [Abditibacteriaceae bacterium]|jgi:hypothetical protein